MARNANARRAPGTAVGCSGNDSTAENSAHTTARQARPCDVCGVQAVVWGPGIARSAEHFDFDHHPSPPPPAPMPRQRVLDLFARARAAGRLRA